MYAFARAPSGMSLRSHAGATGRWRRAPCAAVCHLPHVEAAQVIAHDSVSQHIHVQAHIGNVASRYLLFDALHQCMSLGWVTVLMHADDRRFDATARCSKDVATNTTKDPARHQS